MMTVEAQNNLTGFRSFFGLVHSPMAFGFNVEVPSWIKVDLNTWDLL